MAEHGMRFTTKVDGVLDSYTLDYKMPSVIWSRVVLADESVTEVIPMVAQADNVQVFCTPLDYSYPTTTPTAATVSKKGDIHRDDLSRYYTVPQPHVALLDRGTGEIEITPGINPGDSPAQDGLYIKPDLLQCRTRSLVVVVGDVTVDDVELVYGIEGYGMSDGTRTINQNYSNFFLREQIEIALVTNPRRSTIGVPTKGGTSSFYWDTATGGTSNSVLFDVVKVPLNSEISVNDPAFVIIDADTSSEITFVGFLSSNGMYSHACFYCPNLQNTHVVRFSVMTPPTDNGMEYKVKEGLFYSKHCYHDKSVGNKWGTISGNPTGMQTLQFNYVSMYATEDPDAYGAIIKNNNGVTVFNSTMFVCDNPGLYAMSGLELGVKQNGYSFRTTDIVDTFVPFAERPHYKRNVIGGTFNNIDLCFYQANWDHESKTGVWPVEYIDHYFTYIQNLGSSSAVVKLVKSNAGYNLHATMAPTWHWLNKEGSRSSGWGGLVGVVVAVIGAVVSYFGFYNIGASLISAGLAMMNMQVRDGTIGALSAFLYQEDAAHIYTVDTIDLLEKYGYSADTGVESVVVPNTSGMTPVLIPKPTPIIM